MINKSFMLILILLFVIPVAIAGTDYNESGLGDGSFALSITDTRGDEAQWNEFRTTADFTTSSRVITSTQTPLVSDLDGDGTNEIIVLDDRTFRLFQGRDLTVVSGGTHALPASGRYSNYIAFDIDGDGLTEIIIAEEERPFLHILEFNGSVFTNETSFDLTSINRKTSTTAGEIIIKCSDVNRCLMVETNSTDGDATVDLLTAHFFNSTFIGNSVTIKEGSAASNAFCASKIKEMVAVDFDVDGTVEFITAWMDTGVTAIDDNIEIYYIDVSATNVVSLQKTNRIDTNGDIHTGLVECDDDNVGILFTPPLVMDTDGDTSGLETVIGFNVDDDTHVLWTFSETASGLNQFDDDFPETCCTFTGAASTCTGLTLTCGDGELVSNVIKANAFTDTGKGTANECQDGTDRCDFCVMGYDRTDNELDLLCGSSLTQQLFQSRTFEFDINSLPVPYNVTTDYGVWHIITHSTQQSQDVVDCAGDTTDLDEILTSYGVFELDCTGFDNMDLIFQNPKDDAVVLSIDIEKVGKEDLLVQTATNLFYLDDKFVNQPAEIITTTQAFNPCLDSVWQINTSVEVSFKVSDPDETSGIVSARATLYADDSNEQTTEFVNSTTGTEFPFTFIANKTITSGKIRLEATDDDNFPTVTDTIEKFFTVSTNGVVFNDCTSDLVVIPPPDDEVECTTDADCTSLQFCSSAGICTSKEEDDEDNSIASGLITFTNLTGLGTTTIWLILMLTFSFGIWRLSAEKDWSGNSALGMVGITNSLFIIIGARLGILSSGLVVIIVVLGVIILGVFLGKFLTGVKTD